MWTYDIQKSNINKHKKQFLRQGGKNDYSVSIVAMATILLIFEPPNHPPRNHRRAAHYTRVWPRLSAAATSKGPQAWRWRRPTSAVPSHRMPARYRSTVPAAATSPNHIIPIRYHATMQLCCHNYHGTITLIPRATVATTAATTPQGPGVRRAAHGAAVAGEALRPAQPVVYRHIALAPYHAVPCVVCWVLCRRPRAMARHMMTASVEV